MKTRHIPKITSSKKASIQSVKMPKQKFEFEYRREDFVNTIIAFSIILIPYIILQGLLVIFTEANSDIRMSLRYIPVIGSIVFVILRGFMRRLIKPKLLGYAILHETYVELQLDKVLHIIKYQEIKYVTSIGARGGGGILIIALKGKRDINIGMLVSTFGSKRDKESFLPLLEFKKALNMKLEEMNQAKAKT